ncbi:MAG: hypothetical protein GY809_07950, partial [Planctomycetes bacterium]|nr:hypothetical protein [Planctomycetota bacterium]
KRSRERHKQTFQATALVHEAYLRLVGPQAKCFNNKAHFFAAAAESMRRILIENARRIGYWIFILFISNLCCGRRVV